MSANSVHIRPAVAADLNELFHLEQLCFDAESFNRRQLRYLAHRANGLFWILTDEGRIAAFIILLERKNTEGLRVYSLAVSPAFRGRSYAQQMIQQALVLAQERAKRFLYLEVSEHNGAAIQLYRKLGFMETGRRKAYYKDGSAALLMRLFID
ncbi:GNAT family N-acetyltransferase [Sunxiuqinia elliptica]|uniref:Ribosomal protein S18 acetylase RimI n=1 Tax=Sunxiuqinia elliptica TaxID=655355 RepID=A0A1I2C8X4_9BACT|nr:N-acetyltransferase [Sunxiuqinia elliptica]SFE64799.1 Ribosomal protein S18 acetylase RimI [Sunxiuqinia elliptica]